MRAGVGYRDCWCTGQWWGGDPVGIPLDLSRTEPDHAYTYCAPTDIQSARGSTILKERQILEAKQVLYIPLTVRMLRFFTCKIIKLLFLISCLLCSDVLYYPKKTVKHIPLFTLSPIGINNELKVLSREKRVLFEFNTSPSPFFRKFRE